MAPCLGQNPAPGIDQDNGSRSGGCARRHIAGILLMTWRIRDDEFALVGGKETIGDVNGDALFPFGL